MDGLLCQGRSVSPTKYENGLQVHLMPNTRPNMTGINRSGNRFKVRGSYEVCTTPMELQGRPCKGAMSSPNTRKSYQQYQNKRCGSYIDISDATHRMSKARPKTSFGARGYEGNLPKTVLDGRGFAGDLPAATEVAGQKPKIFLESSASGNNINFTCRIDKRLLRSPTSMAIHIDDYGQPKLDLDVSPELAALQLDCTVTPPTAAAADTGFHDGVRSSGVFGGATSPASAKADSTKCQLKSLSLDNMHIFEQKHILNPSQKKKTVENWIDEVMHARQMVPLLQACFRNYPSTELPNPMTTGPPTPAYHQQQQQQLHLQHQQQQRSDKFAKRSSGASTPLGAAVRRLAPGITTGGGSGGKNSPAPREFESEKRSHPTSSSNMTAMKNKKDESIPVVDDKTGLQRRRSEPHKFARAKQDKADPAFSKEIYDAFAIKKVKKKPNRILKRDVKPQLCKTPAPPNSDDGCSLM